MRSHTPVIQRQTSLRVPPSALVAPAHCFPQERCPGRREWVVTPAGRRAGDSDTGLESNLKLLCRGWRRLGGAGGGEDARPGPSREPATIPSFKYLMPYAVDAGAYVAAPRWSRTHRRVRPSQWAAPKFLPQVSLGPSVLTQTVASLESVGGGHWRTTGPVSGSLLISSCKLVSHCSHPDSKVVVGE